MVAPVAGLMAGKVLPDTLSTNLPPMNSGWSFTFVGLTRRDFSVTAVAMTTPSIGNWLTPHAASLDRQEPIRLRERLQHQPLEPDLLGHCVRVQLQPDRPRFD